MITGLISFIFIGIPVANDGMFNDGGVWKIVFPIGLIVQRSLWLILTLDVLVKLSKSVKTLDGNLEQVKKLDVLDQSCTD